ncbi:MAG TPA: CoA transferase [Candidatus Acidoferrales bacterium]|nr:CoA transferase [Candidatus Acidoferrales bacterium]
MLPLSDVRVVEFCHTIMGPSCGFVLAELGADVVKVEAAPNGDATRRLGGFAAGFFPCFNRSKRSLLVDLKTERGQEIVRALIARSDVLIENYGPGTLDRLGFGADAVEKMNPKIIYCALKGFLHGPYERRPALDEVVQYMTGLAYMTGLPDRPLRAGSSIVDIMGGVFGVVGILAALRERDRTGKGARMTASLFESAAFLVAQHMAAEAVTGLPPPPMSMRYPAWGIYETFPTADGTPIFIGATSNAHWESFCRALGREDLLGVPEFSDNNKRVAAKDKLIPIVAEIVRKHSFAELAEIFERESIPFSPVAKPGDLFEDEQLNAHGWLERTELVTGAMTKLPGIPLEFADHKLGLRHQPPQLGQHTDEILRELGLA